MKKYIVHPGDTMWTISQAVGVRMNLLLAANPQINDPESLRPGTIIAIPELYKSSALKNQGNVKVNQQHQPIKSPSRKPRARRQPYMGYVLQHTVSPSETWDGIAKKYGVAVEQLHSINGTEGKQIRPGKRLFIPHHGNLLPSSQANSKPTADTHHHQYAPVATPNQTNAVSADVPFPADAEELPGVTFSGGPTGPHQHNPFRSTYDPLLDSEWNSDNEHD